MNVVRRPAFAQTIERALRSFDVEPIRVLPLLTVVLLLTSAPAQWYLVGPLVALFALGVVYRRWLARPAFWYVVATLLGTTVYLNWESSDNHKYLFVYWCLALTSALSLPREQQAPALAQSSRWLIGLCMLLAVLWKVSTPEYCSGSFFHYTLLADDRFAQFTSLAAGVPLDQLRDNAKLVDLLREGHLTAGTSIASVVLASSPAVNLLALAMTWWTVAIEGLLAVLYLAPNGRRLAASRNLLLVLFAATTYLIAPVRGFGWMLMLLGLAQCEDRDRIFRPLFLAALVLIQIYTLPFATVVQRLTQ
ncbi:MAG TPA: hypothetical protein VFB80_19835 [Pirellulaceae bacterium]|nr:hypothetical protein [Pirellulaceae bacterium]